MNQTGTIISLNDSAALPLQSLKLTFAPIQAGEGDPSPDNVRPISGRDSVQVTRCGKNLLLFNTQNMEATMSGVNCKYDSQTQIFTISGTNSSGSAQVILASYKYTLPYLKAGSVISLHGNVPDGAYVQINYQDASGKDKELISTRNEVSVTVPADFAKTITVFVGAYAGASFTNDQFTVQLELGSTPTAYEPYQGSTTTLTLPETIYGGTVDAVSGVGSKEWFTVTLTGDETWAAWVADIPRPNSFYTDIVGHKNLANDASNVLCNSFAFDNGENRYTPYHFFSQNPGMYPDNVRMCFTFDETVTSTELAKQWLATQAAAGTPVTICYKLATPEPFQVTPQPISSLYPNTTIYNSEGAEMYCQYIQAPDLPEDNPFVNPLSEIGQYYKRLAGYSDSVPLPPRCRETHLIYKLIDSSYTVPFTDAHSRIEKYLWDLINETEIMIDETPLSDAEKFLAMLIGVQVTDYPYLNTERNFWMSRCVETRAANIALIGAGGEL